jgi:hypothetical protein
MAGFMEWSPYWETALITLARQICGGEGWFMQKGTMTGELGGDRSKKIKIKNEKYRGANQRK